MASAWLAERQPFDAHPHANGTTFAEEVAGSAARACAHAHGSRSVRRAPEIRSPGCEARMPASSASVGASDIYSYSAMSDVQLPLEGKTEGPMPCAHC
eukprot:3819583-Pleurochrysis_carterae.AAC.1